MLRTIICGPPRAGKSTYVAKHAKPGEVRIDLDDLWKVLLGYDRGNRTQAHLGFMSAVKNALIKRIFDSSLDAWVISGGATRSERASLMRRLDTDKVVLIVPSIAQCLSRTTDDHLIEAIHKWYKEYED
jgi:predicted kinase